MAATSHLSCAAWAQAATGGVSASHLMLDCQKLLPRRLCALQMKVRAWCVKRSLHIICVICV